jgi:hypothetical protein
VPSDKGERRGIAKPHANPFLAFRHFQRVGSQRSIHLLRPSLFQPGNAPELSPSGSCPRRDRSSSPRPFLPCRSRLYSDSSVGFEGFIPLRSEWPAEA